LNQPPDQLLSVCFLLVRIVPRLIRYDTATLTLDAYYGWILVNKLIDEMRTTVNRHECRVLFPNTCVGRGTLRSEMGLLRGVLAVIVPLEASFLARHAWCLRKTVSSASLFGRAFALDAFACARAKYRHFEANKCRH
jgi:hypothetical protein